MVGALTGADELALDLDNAWDEDVLAALWDGAPSALSIGDRNALLLGVLAATYGRRLSWQLDCGACGASLDLDVDIVDLLAAQPEPTALHAFRVPTGADLAAVAGLPLDAARAMLLARCVEGAVDDADAIENAMAAADPLADITLVISCAACSANASVSVDVAAELRARLSTPAELLEDVHALALTYGWTEPDVLALTRPRRQEYLALIADLA
jgi:hypothetical protein